MADKEKLPKNEFGVYEVPIETLMQDMRDGYNVLEKSAAIEKERLARMMAEGQEYSRQLQADWPDNLRQVNQPPRYAPHQSTTMRQQRETNIPTPQRGIAPVETLGPADRRLKSFLEQNPDQARALAARGETGLLRKLGVDALSEENQGILTREMGRGARNALTDIGRGLKNMLERGGSDALRIYARGKAKAMEIEAEGEADAKRGMVPYRGRALLIDAQTRKETARTIAPAAAAAIREIPRFGRENRFSPAEVDGLVNTVQRRTTDLFVEARNHVEHVLDRFDALVDRAGSMPVQVKEETVRERYAHPAKPSRGDRKPRQESERLEERVIQRRSETPPTLRIQLGEVKMPSAEMNRVSTMAVGVDASADVGFYQDGGLSSIHVDSGECGGAAASWDNVTITGGSFGGDEISIEYH